MANTKLVFLSTEGNEELTTYLTEKNELSINIEIPGAHDGFYVTMDKITALAFIEHLKNEIKSL
jgi:hypothetical protein